MMIRDGKKVQSSECRRLRAPRSVLVSFARDKASPERQSVDVDLHDRFLGETRANRDSDIIPVLLQRGWPRRSCAPGPRCGRTLEGPLTSLGSFRVSTESDSASSWRPAESARRTTSNEHQ